MSRGYYEETASVELKLMRRVLAAASGASFEGSKRVRETVNISCEITACCIQHRTTVIGL